MNHSPATRLAQSLTKRGHTVLTPRDMRVLGAIAVLRASEGWPPTVRELCCELDRTNNAVQVVLVKLRRLGLVSQDGARSLQVCCRLEVCNGN